MRSYWLKIILGACAVFLRGIRRRFGGPKIEGQDQEPRGIERSSLAFRWPFCRSRSTARRPAPSRVSGSIVTRPKSLNGITLRITLADSADPARIQACLITLEGNGHDFDPARGFRCLKPEEADSSLVAFGEVRFSVRHGEDFTVPLMLDSAAVADMRESGDADIEATVGAEAEARAEAAAASRRTRSPRRCRSRWTRSSGMPLLRGPPGSPRAGKSRLRRGFLSHFDNMF